MSDDKPTRVVVILGHLPLDQNSRYQYLSTIAAQVAGQLGVAQECVVLTDRSSLRDELGPELAERTELALDQDDNSSATLPYLGIAGAVGALMSYPEKPALRLPRGEQSRDWEQRERSRPGRRRRR